MKKTLWITGLAIMGATAAACAGKSVTSGDTCGAGTERDGGVCVPISGGVDATAPTDAPGTLEDADVDGSVSDAAATDAADAADAADAEPPSDPCPPTGNNDPNVTVDCDPKCSTNPQLGCSQISCRATPEQSLGWYQGVPIQWPVVMRTPEAPGVDPNCSPLCPGQGFVYGMGFNVDETNQGSSQVKVDPPWFLIQGSQTPYCTDSHSAPPAKCIWIANYDKRPVYVLTKDPNAPARNIHIEAQSNPAVACQ